VLGKQLPRALADKPDAERVDEPRKPLFFARFDFVQKILRRFFGHPFEVGELLEIEAEIEIGDVLDEIFLHELVHDFFSQAVDVHCVAAGEVQQRFLALGRAGGVDTAVGHFVG